MSLFTTYIVVSKRVGRIEFRFNAQGDLVFFSFDGEPFTEKQRKWFYPRIPITENQIKTWTAIKEFTVSKGEPDISFANFWNTYKVKQKRTRSEQLYNKLSDTDKFNAIAYIKKYDNWLHQQRGIAKALPDTYLNQKRWLDEE